MAQSVQLQKMSPQHHLLVEHILAHAHEKGWALRCCEAFGISRSWLSIVMNSDSFRERFAARLAQHQAISSFEITHKVTEVAKKALDRLSDILDKGDEIDDRLVLDIANATCKQLGFGAKPGAGPVLEREVTRETTRVVSPGVLERARETWRTQVNGTELVKA